MSSNNRDRLDAGASASARAAPAVRSLAKKLGVDLEKCVGTGRDGAITMNDVIARTNQASRANRAEKAPAARPTQSQPIQSPVQSSVESPLQPAPSQPSRRSSPEPVSATPPPVAPVVRPVSGPIPNQPRGWMSDLEAPAQPQVNQAPAPSPLPREQARAQPRPQPSAQTWATMEEDELPPEQPEPRIITSRLQDLSSYDFPSAERQPSEPQNNQIDPYAPRTSWFATAETTQETVTSYAATMVPVQPDPPAEPVQAPNPWGAIEVEEQDQESGAQTSSLEASEAQVEEYVELASEEPAAAEQASEPELAEADEALTDDLTQYEPESQDPAVMTTAYEAPAVQPQADLAPEADWLKPDPLAPETPEEWAQPAYASYANTASAGNEARSVPLRTPYLDMTPRTLIDQEDRLHGQRRNMALNMTRARDEVATCTMFDDADLNAWPNFTHITVRLLRAIVAGIRVEPGFNATFDPAGPSRRLLRQINVAVSVDTREGLTVPVLRDVGSRSLDDLREYVYHMKERTLTRSLAPEDLRDFSFSLVNYGIFAGRYATPLVVPPTVATLGCGRLERGVVAGETVPEIHAMLPLSLTFDHRCVTMGEACRFLAALKQDLELPQ